MQQAEPMLVMTASGMVLWPAEASRLFQLEIIVLKQILFSDCLFSYIAKEANTSGGVNLLYS